MKKEIIIGFLVSLFATFCGLFLYTQYVSEESFGQTISVIKEGGFLGTVLALSAIPNLFVFFIYLKKNQDYRARGVVIGTMLVAFITFVLKFV